MTIDVSTFTTKIYGDGANLESMLELTKNPLIQGFTTNPTLMRQAGVDDYTLFAKQVLAEITEHPISFEVFADDEAEMERQAMLLAGLGPNVYVKIPVTNTQGKSCTGLITRLSSQGVKLNVTALMTTEQVQEVTDAFAPDVPGIISLFAGRIADAGQDPVPMVKKAVEIMKAKPKLELIWASPREILNIVQANECGCHIITVTPDILKKLPNLGKNLTQYSLETVQMFFNDAQAAGYVL